jgi:hypothetical protein
VPTDRSAQDHRAEVEELLADYRHSRDRLEQTHRELAAVTAEATNPDGTVRVVVGHRGVLREVVLADDVYRRLRPAELAATIVRLTGQAAATAAARAAEVLAAVLPSGTDPELLLGEVAAPEPEAEPDQRSRSAYDTSEEDLSQSSWLRSGSVKRT